MTMPNNNKNIVGHVYIITITQNLNVVIFLKKKHFHNFGVSPHADCESNSFYR